MMSGEAVGWRWRAVLRARILDSCQPACVCVCAHIQSFIHPLTHLSVLLADSTSSKLELGLSAGVKKGSYDDG